MRRYEQIYILRPSLGEEQINQLIENTNQIIISTGGSIISLNKWGMKKLAYQIKKEGQGYYVFCDFAAGPQAVAEIERKFRIDDSVLKYLTVKTAEDISAEEISAAQAEAESKTAAGSGEEDAGESADDSADKADKESETAESGK